MDKEYILNKETQKIELHFNKDDYNNLSLELKKELKSCYLWSNYNKCWASRSKHNHYSAIKLAEKLGFINSGSKGKRLSYKDELKQKSQKAENKIERYETYIENTENKAENLQKEYNSYKGDIAFFTQPIIIGHSGSQRFAKHRERIFNKYRKSFDEYKKSEYFKEKIQTFENTKNMEQLKNPIYLNNRIKECKKDIKQLEKNVDTYQRVLEKKENNDNNLHTFYVEKSIKEIETYLNDTLEKLEYYIDKLAFLEINLEKAITENRNKIYSKEDLKVGYLYKNYRHDVWAKIIRLNPKTITGLYYDAPLKGFDASCLYSEIKEIKIPDNFKEEQKEDFKNPFNVNDILVLYAYYDSNKINYAYQVIKTTIKSVVIQEINVDNNIPIIDHFAENTTSQRKQIAVDNCIYIRNSKSIKYKSLEV